MEFEEMQVIWNNQNNEKLYAINESAMYASIQRKGNSINFWIGFAEYMMIGVNIVIGIYLFYDMIIENEQGFGFVIPVMYVAYSILGIFFRLRRRKNLVKFEETMLGELDKAIWQANYIIRQGHALLYWYLAPLSIVAFLKFILDGDFLWGAAMLLLLPLTYYGMRWEYSKWHGPKKRELESLRETILSGDNQ